MSVQNHLGSLPPFRCFPRLAEKQITAENWPLVPATEQRRGPGLAWGDGCPALKTTQMWHFLNTEVNAQEDEYKTGDYQNSHLQTGYPSGLSTRVQRLLRAGARSPRLQLCHQTARKGSPRTDAARSPCSPWSPPILTEYHST